MAKRFTVEAVFKAVDRITAPVSRMQNRVLKFTRAMSRGLNKVNRVVGKMTRAVGAGFRRIALVGTIALTGLSLAIRGVANEADALVKRTRRLKFPIEEFQEWQFIAEQSGLTTQQFDKSIEKFTKTVGEARSGTGTLVTLLKKSNPELLKQVTSANSVADALDIYVKGLRNTENQLDKTALAAAAFGARGGGKFLNITEQSEAAIRALRIEQRENGIITEKQANAAEAYNDAMNSLRRAIKGFMQSVILPLLPMLTKTIRSFREWAVVNKEIISERVIEFVKTLINNFQTITMWTKRIAIGLAVFVAFIAILKTLIGVLTLVNLVMAANPITLVVLAVAALTAAFVALVVWVDEVLALFDKMPFTLQLAFAPLKIIIKAIKFIKDNFDVITSAASKLAAFLGFGDDDAETEESTEIGENIVSPQERVARNIDERRSISTSEVVIRDESGRAEVTSGKLGSGLTLEPTGAF